MQKIAVKKKKTLLLTKSVYFCQQMRVGRVTAVVEKNNFVPSQIITTGYSLCSKQVCEFRMPEVRNRVELPVWTTKWDPTLPLWLSTMVIQFGSIMYRFNACNRRCIRLLLPSSLDNFVDKILNLFRHRTSSMEPLMGCDDNGIELESANWNLIRLLVEAR